MSQLEKSAERQARIKEKDRKYREKNKDKIRLQNRERNRRYREAHPDRIKEAKKRCRAAKPETQRALTRCRRAAKKGAAGRYVSADITKLGKAQRHRCAYCRCSIKVGFEIDHIIAIANGGTNWPANLQLLCLPCNRSKGMRDPLEFARTKFGALL